jgi:protease I
MKILLQDVRVAILIEQGVNEIEFHTIRLRLREAGADVVVVGNHELEYCGEDHERLRADRTIDQVEAADFDGVFIPGGLAPEKLRQNPQIIRFIREIAEEGKICAAICHGQQVLLSAGLLKERHVVAAWSMVDDLISAGALHDSEARAIRDGNLVTARFPHDLPRFFLKIWEALGETGDDPLADSPGIDSKARRIGIVVDDATNAAQLFYCRYRIEEEGMMIFLLGRASSKRVRLGSPTWEWAEHGPTVVLDRGLRDAGVPNSDDLIHDQNLEAIRAEDLDGLIIPGGLASWLLRGHPGLKELIRAMDASGQAISVIERGAKVLLSAGILKGRHVTGSKEIRDDLILAGLQFRDEAVVRDEHLLFCRGTEDLPLWGPAWIKMVEEAKWRH